MQKNYALNIKMSNLPKVVAPLLICLTFSAGMPATATAGTAGDMHCTVSSVHDGDSLRVRCPGSQRSIRIRMEQIDAPELEQAHGKHSRDYLRRLCRVGTDVIVRPTGKDQYGRLLGNVYCGGKSVNEEMVGSGSAWVYKRYARDQKLYRLQNEARTQRRGLWAGARPTEPWRWRYEQRERP